MARQPVNFEQERQRILAEIEARAKERGGELTLQDWLKAAEEVMPDSAALQSGAGSLHDSGTEELSEDRVSLSTSGRSKRRSRTRTRSPERKVESGGAGLDPSGATAERHNPDKEEGDEQMGAKNAFWIGILGITLLVALLSAGGLAFHKLQNEISSLNTRLEQMETRLAKLEKSKIVANDAAPLNALVARLEALEKKALPVDARQQVSDQVHSELTDANVVTEAVLDAKLAQFSRRIEQVIDRRFATLLVQLKSLRTASLPPTDAMHPAEKAEETPKEEASHEPVIEPPAPPASPKEPEVEPVAAQQQAQDAQALTESEQWLARQPADHWTLQLASVLDKASLDHMIRTKKLNEARIIRQLRDGQIRYVLVQGSFADRATAREAAAAIRARTGISPWVRPFRPLQARLPH